jgi:hypothetical protein
MGMDVIGRAPRSERGKYFRSSLFWWRPHADYFQHVAPEICQSCADWYTNDGMASTMLKHSR